MAAHGRIRGAWRRLSLEPSWAGIALATPVLAAADWGKRLAGDSVIPGGPIDELAHLLTTLLIFWALGERTRRRFMVPALAASVAIDVDHVPDRLGIGWFTSGTPRPYTHSLLTIVVVLGVAMLWRPRRDLLLGVAIGLTIHFWRDMGEGGGGVALLWPFSDRAFHYPHGGYVAAMAIVLAITAARLARRRSLAPVLRREPANG
jgi:hypothetical protein